MSWNHFDGKGIEVIQQKTGARLWIPAHERLLAVLDEIPKRAAVILTTRSGRPWKQTHYEHEVAKLVKACGLTGYSLHGLRKNATENLFEAGCTPQQVQAITGHASLQMLEFYGKGANQRRMASAAITKLEQYKNAK